MKQYAIYDITSKQTIKSAVVSAESESAALTLFFTKAAYITESIVDGKHEIVVYETMPSSGLIKLQTNK